jgi:peptidoglycan/LPS O-acetylase OafA/YrhL
MNQAAIAGEPRDHIPRLDVLRAVAILLVFGFHYAGNLIPAFTATATHASNSGFEGTIDSLVLHLMPLGACGVPLFFVISGFCIHLSVLRRRGAFQAGDFYWRRFLRIYPAYFIALVIFSLLGLFKILNSLNLKMFLAHLFLVHNFFDYHVLMSINAAFWSLAVECQFYLLYPLVLLAPGKSGLKLWLFFTILICILEQGLCSVSPGFTHFTQDQFCLGRTLGTWCDWILGACLAEAYVKRERFFQRRVFWIVASSALFVVGHNFPFIFEFRFLLDSFFCAVLLEIYLASSKPLARIERLLVPVGLISYSIYLWHQPLIKPLWYFLHAHCPLPTTALWELLFFLPLTALILSPVFVTSYWLTEKAAPKLVRGWFTPRTLPASQTFPQSDLAPGKVAAD